MSELDKSVANGGAQGQESPVKVVNLNDLDHLSQEQVS